MIADVYHIFWDAFVEREIARAGTRISGFHVSDWTTPTGDVTADRAMIGDGCIDLALLQRAVTAAGYAGDIEIEILNAAHGKARTSTPGSTPRSRATPPRATVASKRDVSAAFARFRSYARRTRRTAQGGCLPDSNVRRAGTYGCGDSLLRRRGVMIRVFAFALAALILAACGGGGGGGGTTTVPGPTATPTPPPIQTTGVQRAVVNQALSVRPRPVVSTRWRA